MIVQANDRYKEAMNTAIIPAGLTPGMNNAANTPNTFAKELRQKSDFINDVDISHHSSPRREMADEPKDIMKKNTAPDKEPLPERKAPAETESAAPKENREPVRKDSGDTHRDNQSKNSGAHNADKTTSPDENGKNSSPADKTINAKFREIIREHHLKLETISGAKETAGEQFSEQSKLKAESAAEKTALKTLEGKSPKQNAAPSLSETETPKTDDGKTNGDAAMDKHLLSELEALRKDAATPKTDVKTAKDSPVTDPADPRFLNAPHLQDKTAPSANDAKVQALLRQAPPEQAKLWNDQIVSNLENSIKMLISDGEKKVGIQLQPPELGKVHVELTMKDNRVDIRINTENQAVKEIILNNFNQLKVSIEDANVSINRFDVEVGGFKNQFEQARDQGHNHSGRGGDGGGDADPLSIPDSDWLPDKIIRQQALTWTIGRSVNYLV